MNQVVSTEGQTVRAGQLLLSMDDKDIQAQLDQARAQMASEEDDLRAAEGGGRSDRAARVAGDVRAAEAQRDMLQHQQEALTKLLAEKAATPDEVAQNRTALERANVEVDQAQKAKQEFDRQAPQDRERLALLVAHSQGQVRDLQEKVASAKVVAPVSGSLFSLPVHSGDFVHTGDLLADIADLRKVRVRAYIDEPELGKLQPNQTVEVSWDALPDRTWIGHTEYVPKQVVARGARNVGEVLCTVANEHFELIPNTTVDIRIQISEHRNVLTVPRGAVQIVGAHRYVFRLDGDHLRRTEIKVGISDSANFEVLSGVRKVRSWRFPVMCRSKTIWRCAQYFQNEIPVCTPRWRVVAREKPQVPRGDRGRTVLRVRVQKAAEKRMSRGSTIFGGSSMPIAKAAAAVLSILLLQLVAPVAGPGAASHRGNRRSCLQISSGCTTPAITRRRRRR